MFFGFKTLITKTLAFTAITLLNLILKDSLRLSVTKVVYKEKIVGY